MKSQISSKDQFKEEDDSKRKFTKKDKSQEKRDLQKQKMREERSKEKLAKDEKELSNIMDSLTSLQSKVAMMDNSTRNDSFSQGQLKIIESLIEKKINSGIISGNNTATQADQNFVINTMSASSISNHQFLSKPNDSQNSFNKNSSYPDTINVEQPFSRATNDKKDDNPTPQCHSRDQSREKIR